MFHKFFIQDHNRGFSLLEVLISVAVFLIFAISIYQSYSFLQTAIALVKYKALAADLANERFEVIKNLPFSDVGVVGGNPSGVILPEEIFVRDNTSFTVNTTVVHVDDPFDGTSGAGDPIPNDYKLIEIKISCDSCKNFNAVVFSGFFAPKGLESV